VASTPSLRLDATMSSDGRGATTSGVMARCTWAIWVADGWALLTRRKACVSRSGCQVDPTQFQFKSEFSLPSATL
jgi:hypothetical protein